MKNSRFKIFFLILILFFSLSAAALTRAEKNEAALIYKSGSDLNGYLKASKRKRSLKDEAYAMKKYTAALAKNVKGLKIADKNAVNNFIVYGTAITIKLSAIKRYELVKLYKDKYKKLPVKIADWENLLKLNLTNSINIRSPQPLVKGACPDGYDGKNFTLNGAKLGVDAAQVDWINAHCEKFMAKDFSTEPISGSIPDGIIQTDKIEEALAVSPKNPDVVYAGTEGNGIFKSLDGGKTWRWLRTGLRHGPSCSNAYPEAYGLVIDPRNDLVIYAAMTCGPENPTNAVGGVYKSTDGGESWAQKIKGLPNAAVDAIALDENNPDIIYAGTNGEKLTSKKENLSGGIYKSTDGGENWTAVYEKANRFDKIIVKNNVIIASGLRWKDAGSSRLPDPDGSAGLIKSADGGKTWSVIKKDFITAFDFTADGKIYAATADGVGYFSVDGGLSWSGTDIKGPIALSPFDSKIMFYASIKKSVNGVVREVVKTKKWISRVAFTADPKIIYAGSPGYVICKSIDAGETFSEIANLRKFIDSYKN